MAFLPGQEANRPIIDSIFNILIIISMTIIASTVNVVIISITIFGYCTRRHHSNAK